MRNLLHFEFHKLVRRKTCYILPAVLIAYLLLNAGIYKALELFTADGTVVVPVTRTSLFFSSLTSTLTTMMLGLCIALFVCEDRMNDTMKNVTARGFHPNKVLTAELIASLVYTALFVFVGWIAGFLFSSALFGTTSSISAGDAVARLFVQFVCILAYATLFIFISKLVPKAGSAIALCILIPYAVGLVLSLIDLIPALANHNISLYRYTLGGALSETGDLTSKMSDVWISFALAIVYATAFLVTTYLCNKKRSS